MTAEQKREAAARKDAAALHNIPRMAFLHMASQMSRSVFRSRV